MSDRMTDERFEYITKRLKGAPSCAKTSVCHLGVELRREVLALRAERDKLQKSLNGWQEPSDD